MSKQTSIPVPLIALGDLVKIYHRGGSSQSMKFHGVDPSCKRGELIGPGGGLYQFWLRTEGKHRSGEFCTKDMVWWRVGSDTIESTLAFADQLREEYAK